MSGDDREGPREFAVGDGNARHRRSGDRDADPRHELVVDARLAELQHLLCSPTEDQRVATLEPDHPPASPGVLDEQLVDRSLLGHLPSAALAHVDDDGLPRDQLEDGGTHEGIVKDDLRRLQHLETTNGEQSRVARSSADEPDHQASSEVEVSRVAESTPSSGNRVGTQKM